MPGGAATLDGVGAVTVVVGARADRSACLVPPPHAATNTTSARTARASGDRRRGLLAGAPSPEPLPTALAIDPTLSENVPDCTRASCLASGIAKEPGAGMVVGRVGRSLHVRAARLRAFHR